MCYGDIDHGRDGYYRAWMEGMEEESRQKEEAIRQQIEEQQQQTGNPS
jgi:hypothetical protein